MKQGVEMKAMTETRNLALSIVETVAETVAEPLLVLDSMMRIRTANQAFYRVFRVTPHETEGQLLFSLSNARWDILDLRDLLERVLPNHNPFQDLEIEQDFPGVGYRVLLLSGRQLDGFPLILLTIDDLTERRERDLRLAAIVESSDDAILSTTLDGTIVSWNSGAERIYGYAAHEMIGQPISTLAPKGHEEEMSAIMERIRRGEKVNHFETKCRCKDAESIDISVTISPIGGRHGVITGASMVACDITELKRRQQQDLAKHKLECLGRLADGITHNFNNLLGGVLASAQLALTDCDNGSPVVDQLQKICTATIRAVEIIRQLMIYSARENLAFEPVDLSLLIEEMYQLVQVSISKHATLKIDLGKDLPTVQVAPTQIRQVVMNLVINAAEAIGEKDGVIGVTTERVKVGPNSDVISAENLPEGNYVALEVSDTGCGLTPDVQATVFDPFFTTKGAGRGLGLALVQGIIRAHSGAISLRSAPGQGTTFQVLLPCMGKPADAHIEIVPVGDQLEPREAMVLVVEDEELIRLAVARTLRKIGFSVIEASDGSAALDLIRANKESINVVLLDVTLPGLPSREVYEEAQRIRPDLKVVLTSAYGKETVDATFAGLRVEHFIRKPFQLNDLVAFLQRALASRKV
jgi:two-component system, cell cycle sensor histidine kinase and response regulator CckA